MRWLGGAAVVLCGLCGLPYLVSALFGPPNLEPIGTFWFSRDFSQYEAAMREGAGESGWLIHDHFSAEPHAAAFMYPLYVGAGKAGALVGIDNLTIFTALEWIGRLALLGAVYAFAQAFLADHRAQKLAVILALATLGLDAWAAPLHAMLDAAGDPGLASLLPSAVNPDLEVSSFGVLLSAPHLMLGLALTLLAAPAYLRAVTAGNRRGWLWLLLLGADVLLLSLVHTFNVPVLVSVLVVHAGLTGRRAWPAAVIAGVAAAPMALYSLVLFQTNPFWSGTYSVQNLMPSPAPWSLPLDFGLVLFGALFAWPSMRSWARDQRWLILLWIGLGLIWMYAPVPYQRRFAFGVQPALATLAAVGLLQVNVWMRAQGWGGLRRRLVNYTLALAAISTTLLIYISLLASAIFDKPTDVYVWSRPEDAAGVWLGDHSTSSDIVMASTDFANPLVGVIDGRVVYGHIVATLHSAEKDAEVKQFYATDTSSLERTALLRTTGATVVALGPAERALGLADLSQQPGLALIYEAGGVQLFRVR